MSLKFYYQNSLNKLIKSQEKLYEGNRKIILSGLEPGTYILSFKDDDNKSDIHGKGVLNNRISSLLMNQLNNIGISTHFIKKLNMNKQLIKSSEVIPIIIDIHNVAYGSFAKRLGLEIGNSFSNPIIEIRFKSKELYNPLISTSHILGLKLASEEELDIMFSISQRINDFLQGQFSALDMRLFSIQLEFGRFYSQDFLDDPEILLIDEISPDTFTLLSNKEKSNDFSINLEENKNDIYRKLLEKFNTLN